jgi:hypothetical protein
MNTPHPHDLVIGLDRSDKKADLHLITPATGQRRSQTIDTAPEALWEWLLELCQQHPQARVGLCLEQPAVHLIAFLESYDWITLYPINPIIEHRMGTGGTRCPTFRNEASQRPTLNPQLSTLYAETDGPRRPAWRFSGKAKSRMNAPGAGTLSRR